MTPETTLRCEPEQELRPIVDLRNPGTPPPRLPFLSTPLGSNIRPLLKQHRAQRTDEHLSFYRVVKMKPLESPLRALTPDTLQSLRESRESPCILHVTPSEFADWHARYPGIDESNSHYEYDSVTERMIIKCMAGPVHDSFAIYFFRAIHAGLRQAGPQCHRGLQLFTSTGESACSTSRHKYSLISCRFPQLQGKVPGHLHPEVSRRVYQGRWRPRVSHSCC